MRSSHLSLQLTQFSESHDLYLSCILYCVLIYIRRWFRNGLQIIHGLGVFLQWIFGIRVTSFERAVNPLGSGRKQKPSGFYLYCYKMSGMRVDCINIKSVELGVTLVARTILIITTMMVMSTKVNDNEL